MSGYLERRCLRVLQNPDTPLYLFVLAAEEVSQVADVARISRDELGKLIGYQRPEKRQHVKQIQDYLDSEHPLFPNGLIMALPQDVRFKSSRGPSVSDGLATAGVLEIPLPESDSGSRPCWIVDGQQRSLALAQMKNRRFPVPVAGFVALNLESQRDQFLRVNTVMPLPTGLVNELLPEVTSAPSPRLSARKLPSALVEMLNGDPESPFKNLIRRASTASETRANVAVTDTSLVRALEESIESPSGVLFPYRNIATNTTDTESIRLLLITYWTAVKETFPDAWGLPPQKSRLMHGVGIRSMSRLMDRVMIGIDIHARDAAKTTQERVRLIEPICRWTHGTWEDLNLPWNELQNTPRHISTLSNYLIRGYISRFGSGA
jgi:DGQHR domain-containing protein